MVLLRKSIPQNHNLKTAAELCVSLSINQGNKMLNQAKLAIGSIVKLKSGGPEMTVQVLPQNSGMFYHCQWFAGRKLESGNFHADSLDLVKTEAE